MVQPLRCSLQPLNPFTRSVPGSRDEAATPLQLQRLTPSWARPGHGFRYHQLCRDPHAASKRQKWRGPVAAEATATLPSPAREARHLKATLQQHLWQEDKGTVQSPPLCPHREQCLRHSPTVVAGELDASLYRDQGTVSGVRRTTGGIPRHQPHVAMRRISPRPWREQGLLYTSKGPWPRTPGIRVPVNRRGHTEYHTPTQLETFRTHE